MTEEREMHLSEWVEKLPASHLAHKEYRMLLEGLTFQRLQFVGWERSKAWSGAYPWSLSDWGVAVGGETGEMLNVIKKLNRSRDAMEGNKETDKELLLQLRSECADIVIYLASLAASEDFDLGEEIIKKFNETSMRKGFEERL